MTVKEYREFFLRNSQVNSGSKVDKELGFDTTYIIENKTVFNRFLKGNYPNAEVYKKLFESVTFKLNVEDTAQEGVQGLVKLSTQAQFDAGNDSDADSFSLQAKTTQVKAHVAASITTAVGNRQYTHQNNISNGETVTASLNGLDQAVQTTETSINTINTTLTTLLPVGSIIMWAGTTAPTGWNLCDGTNSTPNLKGRFIVGYDTSNGDYNAIGNIGGAMDVTLTEAQLPAHSHALKQTPGSLGTGTNVDVLTAAATTSQLTFKSNTTTGSTAGSGNSHENRPPYYTLAYIQKA